MSPSNEKIRLVTVSKRILKTPMMIKNKRINKQNHKVLLTIVTKSYSLHQHSQRNIQSLPKLLLNVSVYKTSVARRAVLTR